MSHVTHARTHARASTPHTRVFAWVLFTGNNYLLLIEFESFPLGVMRAGHKPERKKRGSRTYSTDRENEVSKIFNISLGSKRWRSGAATDDRRASNPKRADNLLVSKKGDFRRQSVRSNFKLILFL